MFPTAGKTQEDCSTEQTNVRDFVITTGFEAPVVLNRMTLVRQAQVLAYADASGRGTGRGVRSSSTRKEPAVLDVHLRKLVYAEAAGRRAAGTGTTTKTALATATRSRGCSCLRASGSTTCCLPRGRRTYAPQPKPCPIAVDLRCTGLGWVGCTPKQTLPLPCTLCTAATRRCLHLFGSRAWSPNDCESTQATLTPGGPHPDRHCR